MLHKLIIHTCFGIALISASMPTHADIILGVHPFKPPTKLENAFTPLAAYLTEKLGEKVTIRISRDYQAHIDAVGKNAVDIAYMGPAPYVKATETYGSRPLLARQAINGKAEFHGRIFVAKDSPIKTLADLKGKRFAFGEAQSTMSYLVPRYMLWQAGINLDILGSHTFVGDHVNVALGVMAGDFDAGAVKEDVFLQYEARGLRSIATSLPLSDHLFVASNTLPKEKVRKLQELLQQLHTEPRGSAILESITHGVTRLLPAQDSDYDSLRAVLHKMKEMGVAY